MPLIARALVSMSVAALCTACVTDAPRAVNPSPVPSNYSHDAPGDTAIADDSDWYSRFGSTELNGLLDSALAGNFDLAAAAARVRQAVARARSVRAAFLPQLDAAGSAQHFTGRSRGTTASETDWSALLSASYELDFWGKNQAAMQASRAAATASIADRETVLLTTRAGLAASYFRVLSLRERQSIAQDDLGTARAVLEAIEARHTAGFASNTDLASQRAVVSGAAVVIDDLEGQQQAALAALAVLTGRDPEGFGVQATSLVGINEPVIDAGLPSGLLRRRPDILAAEATLQAANANLMAARAALFPTIALTASGGVQSPAMQAAVTTLAGTGPTLVIGASLLQSVFDGGHRRALREEAAARAEEMLASYRGAIRNALVDVETALAAHRSLEAQRAARTQVSIQSQLAFEAARARYAAGAGDYLTLLGAQRTLHAVHDTDAQYRFARLQALINLTKALGGGWHAPPPAGVTNKDRT